MRVNFQHPGPDALDAHPNQFDKLRRSDGLSKAAQIGRLDKAVTHLRVHGAALRDRVAAFDRGLAEVAAALRRIEVHKAVVERDALAAEKISAAVHASRAIGPDDLAKALAARGNFFMN